MICQAPSSAAALRAGSKELRIRLTAKAGPPRTTSSAKSSTYLHHTCLSMSCLCSKSATLGLLSYRAPQRYRPNVSTPSGCTYQLCLNTASLCFSAMELGKAQRLGMLLNDRSRGSQEHTQQYSSASGTRRLRPGQRCGGQGAQERAGAGMSRKSSKLTSRPRQRLSQRRWLWARCGWTHCRWWQRWLCVFCRPPQRPAEGAHGHMRATDAAAARIDGSGQLP